MVFLWSVLTDKAYLNVLVVISKLLGQSISDTRQLPSINILSLRNSLIFRWVCIKRGAYCYVTRFINQNTKNVPFPCVFCDQEVRPRQHALECESCFQWQHRLCNTGESEQRNFTHLIRCQTMKVKPYIILNTSRKHVNYEDSGRNDLDSSVP